MGLFKSIGRAIGKGAKGVVKGAGSVVKGTAKGVRSVGRVVGKVPVVGKGLKGAFDLTAAAPFMVADDIVKGKGLNTVALNAIKRNVSSVRATAPYAQMVLSVVPGVGQGVSGAIGAGLALANGQPVSEAIAAAVKGSLPGGPLAQSAFDVGKAAIQGKPIADAALAALPIPASQRTVFKQGLGALKDVADGKRVDQLLLRRLESLPPDVAKGLNLGVAIGEAQKLQGIAPKIVKPAVLTNLNKVGAAFIRKNPMLSAGGGLLNATQKQGMAVAVGLMNTKPSPIQVSAIRTRMTGEQRAGFDIGVSARLGASRAKAVKDPKAKFAAAVTFGVQNQKPANRTALLKRVVKDDTTKKAASKVVKTLKQEQQSWWRRLLVHISQLGAPPVPAGAKVLTAGR